MPLGIARGAQAAAGRRASLALAGVLQTIPSLALLVFMIPLLGIGARPAIVALFLYSLLPDRAEHGDGADAASRPRCASPPRRSACRRARGCGGSSCPWRAPSILAGIKTAAVINVGTATLGALIGAGGYGQPILTGIRLDDTGLILQGAVPAAVLALLVSGLFEVLARFAVPRGLRPDLCPRHMRGSARAKELEMRSIVGASAWDSWGRGERAPRPCCARSCP